jgi:hypothetical protein
MEMKPEHRIKILILLIALLIQTKNQLCFILTIFCFPKYKLICCKLKKKTILFVENVLCLDIFTRLALTCGSDKLCTFYRASWRLFFLPETWER